MRNMPDSDTVSYFSDTQALEKLPGGQDSSWLSGGLVLKPVGDGGCRGDGAVGDADIGEPERYAWLSAAMEVVSLPGIGIAKPARSKRGNWIENGYGATRYFPGEFYRYRIPEKLAAADAFHSLVRHIRKPSGFDSWMNPWTRSGSVAWRKSAVPDFFPGEGKKILRKLFDQYASLSLDEQFIHSDLAGNILFFHDRPVIIDISPAFAPAEYARTLLVTDSIAWHGEGTGSLGMLGYPKEMLRQLALRSVVFRLCVPLFFDNESVDGFMKELDCFSGVLDCLDIRH